MDPLFERRQIVKMVNVSSKYLQKNIQASLMAKLKKNYQAKCTSEGYIHKDSIAVVDYSLGRATSMHSGVDYVVTFQADICLPHAGQKFRAPVKLRSKIGIHAELLPLKILIPRDLHVGNAEFEAVKVDDEIEFEVVGSKFSQGDEDIVVVGKLISQKPAEPEVFDQVQTAEAILPTTSAPVTGDEKQVTIAPPTAEENPKRRKLKRADGV
jgi:DNA-directed RNA polymerase subunit E'/Rpb7